MQRLLLWYARGGRLFGGRKWERRGGSEEGCLAAGQRRKERRRNGPGCIRTADNLAPWIPSPAINQKRNAGKQEWHEQQD